MTYVTQETIDKTVADRNAYFDGLQELPLEMNDLDVEEIAPEDMKVGDHMFFYGFVYEITEIHVRQWESDDIPVYIAEGLYVSGDMGMYKYFLMEKQNGYARGHTSGQQGNARATWKRVTCRKAAV